MDAAADCDVMLFLDDDIQLAPHYIAVTEAAFQAHAGVVVTAGTLLADGARGAGLTHTQARSLLAHAPLPPPEAGPLPAFNGYGCNMAVRLSVVRQHGLRFDERMMFYAWYEDLDFTRRLGVHGRILRLPGAVGGHLGVKAGRGPGARLGYVQMVHPVYLAHKGSYPWNRALRGNLLGLRDLALGRAEPERVRLV